MGGTVEDTLFQRPSGAVINVLRCELLLEAGNLADGLFQTTRSPGKNGSLCSFFKKVDVGLYKPESTEGKRWRRSDEGEGPGIGLARI